MMQHPQLGAVAVVLLASCGLIAAQTTLNTTCLPYLNSLSVCAPFNVLVNESTDGRYCVSVDADAATANALAISTQPGSGIVGVTLESVGDFNSNNPIKITLSLPPGQFTYAELDYSNSQLVIDNLLNASKGEIANNGDGTVIVARGMNGDLNKASIVGAGDLVMRGNGSYTELFSDGSGNRYLSGLTGQINVKHDGSGSITVSPGTNSTSIAGVNTGTGALTYTQGNCTVLKDPNAGPGMVGNACTGVKSVTVPTLTVQWTCGVAVKGNYYCGGAGKGVPPSVTSIPCAAPASELTMFSLNTATE